MSGLILIIWLHLQERRAAREVAELEARNKAAMPVLLGVFARDIVELTQGASS